MSHTPGPWNISMSDNATPHIYANNGHWREKTKDLICVMPAEIMQSFNSLNNARLIVAAPAMKEALEEVQRWSYTQGFSIREKPMWTKVDKALALTNTKGDSTACV